MRRRAAVLTVLASGLVIGSGTAIALGGQEPGEPPHLTPADFVSHALSVGDPTYAGGATDAGSPMERAQRYLEGSGVLDDYPAAQLLSTSASDNLEVIALADGDIQVGELRYGNDGSGWRLDSVSVCSPDSQ